MKGDSERWLQYYQASCLSTVGLINQNIRFLTESLGPRLQSGQPWEVGEDLQGICEAMEDYDRENFLQYCVMAQDGRLTIPTVQFELG